MGLSDGSKEDKTKTFLTMTMKLASAESARKSLRGYEGQQTSDVALAFEHRGFIWRGRGTLQAIC